METVGILIELENADQAYATIKRIESSVKSLGRNKTMIKLDDGNLQSVDDRIKEIQDRLAALSAAKKVGVITDEEVEEAKRLNAELKLLQRGLKDGTQNARSFKQEFQSIQSVIAHIGSGMQSLGNALTRLSSPFTRLTTGLLMGAGYKLLNLATEGLSGAFERADTMKNYSRILVAFGFSAEQAEKAVSDLNDAVLGLPTGLDEIVAVQKRFVAASNDIEKSTALAIAYNNSILASAADARQQKTAQRIMTQLAGGADIASSSWDALQRAIPLVFTELAKDSKMGVADYVKALKTGKISTDEFIESFTRIGKSGAIADAAEVMKKSWSGLAANIANRFRALGQGVIESLHEVFKNETGRDLLDTLLGIDANGKRVGDGVRDWIDNLSESIQNWIKSNPDKIIDFFETLKGIDWKGLLKGMAEGIGEILKLLKSFTEFMGDKDLSKFGKRMIMLGAIGKGLTIFGGIIKGLRGPLALIFTLASRAGKGGGIFGALGKILGGGAKAAGGGLGGSLIGAGINKGTFIGVGKIGLLAAEITGIVGALTTMIAGFAALDMKLLSSATKSFRTMMDDLGAGLQSMAQIKSTDIDMNAVKDLVKKVSEVYQALSGIPMSVSVSKRMAKSAENIRNSVWQLRRAAYQINQAASTSVDVGGFKAFVQQIKEAVASLQDLNQTMELDIKVVLGRGFKTSVDGVVKQIKNARKQIQAAVDYISQKTFTTTVRVNIKARVNMSGAISSINQGVNAVRNAVPVQKSIGGLIYRAKGGSVPFKRKGTDSVPAMLTPGEYVHNKRAVDTFGINFMRKVNSLDMKGAMNELMHRAGHMANVNRGTTITNNYNNNQRVVQNINTNSADFAFRSASRFVGAF